ncbi:5'/3'-nucleotidase SurE [Photobacterium sp. TLY01]|uniref:5'/3'-nucleotidase SurE n=1 Tax=Photobacterium sp. TLY01 TaxID=2907534 RepID=UPI001F1F3D1F|nr:5'/3'-nucleotidase SurE [Photobacterium sp. TLY01]UIP27399.1 5'/3'-nucleotidase SurE [Photobacterium sp. TLY01]
MKLAMEKLLAAGLLSASVISAPVMAMNIVLTNDDSWDTQNIQILKAALVTAGHHVIMSAPCTGQSGKGGAMTFLKPVSVDETKASEHEFCVGDTDTSVAFEDYAEGTPVMAVLYGIDVAAQTVWGKAPDLVISGPNEGNNLGFMNNNSGTLGATMIALSRGIPAIAVSAHENTAHDAAQSELVANAVVEVVATLESSRPAGGPLLPAYTGLNINTPEDMSNHLGYKLTDVGWNSGGIELKFSDDLSSDAVLMGYMVQKLMAGGMDQVTAQATAQAAMQGKQGLSFGMGDAGDANANSEGNAVKAGYITISTIDGNVQAARAKVSLTEQRLLGLN